MRMCAISMAFVAAMLASPAAFAADDQTTTPGATTTTGQTATLPATADTPATTEASDLDQIECRKMPAPTGTMLGARRICQTKRQWQSLQRDSQQTLTNMRNRGGDAGAAGN